MRTFQRTLRRTAVLQIDSVNVLARAHYMPLFSRMGPYDPDLLHRAATRRPRHIVEYWAHVAAYMPVELWPHMRHRMRGYEARGHEWTAIQHRPELVESLVAEVRERGASTSRDLDDGLPRQKVHWGWNWSETKKVLEYLFASGRLAVAGRNQQFERLYDLPERVIPAEHLHAPEPTLEEAAAELLRRAAVAHGVGTEHDLRDYFRLQHDRALLPLVKPALGALVEAGELLPVHVEGWDKPAYLHRDAALPRKVPARALLSPFDPLVWERDRTERLFDFHYRIEIYVPEHKRVHGYYVLPFLLGDRLVARVDLKADRKAGVLQVKGAFAEPGAPEETAHELAQELVDLAGWLGLGAIRVEPRGDLAGALDVVIATLG
ncbi:YcaQ family DNA glycosylase [Nocardioides mesophilus]|uniref:YcaQ family DNA glycosylase n=2 Tax=Nocardioides mesophilus TaxID=433659 RepID=A0A7G9RGU9_9ACTN|nr:YcaQ family DNA glycosylase [Nocardioides mesophilus]